MDSEPTRTISLRFSEGDYAKLREQATSLGLRPAVLARVIVRTTLNAPPQERRRTSRRQFTAALKSLGDVVARGGGALVDPVEVIHRVRNRRADRLDEILSPPPSRK